MRTTTATLAVAAISFAASTVSAAECGVCSKSYDPIADAACRQQNVAGFMVENVLVAPFSLFKAVEDTRDVVASTLCNNGDAEKMFVCGIAAKECKVAAERNFGKKLFVPEQKACKVATPTLTDYVFGMPLGLVIGVPKYAVAAAEKGVNDGYCAGKGGLFGTLAAFPSAAFYGAVGAVQGAVKGTFVGGPWGWAGMRQCGAPFTVYVK